MKKIFIDFKNYCNANSGLMTVFGIIVSIIIYIFSQHPFGGLDIISTGSFFVRVFTLILALLTYTIELPLYLFLLVFFSLTFYIIRVKRKYKITKDFTNFLVGIWKNEWTGSDFSGEQILSISEDWNYFLNGKLEFKINGFKYLPKTSEIIFYKVGQGADDRKLLNKLKIVNNDLLKGTENDVNNPNQIAYNIKYSRYPG